MEATEEKVSSAMTDHDLLIRLNERFDNLLERLDGHVPADCISHTARISQAEKDLEGIKSGHKWTARTTIAAGIAVIGSVAVWLFTEVLPKLL